VRTLWLVIAAAFAIGGGAILLGRGCAREPTAVEQRVDVTLATEPAWRDSVRQRDSVIAAQMAQSTLLRRDRNRWRDTARARLNRADEAQARADSATLWATNLSLIPPGITPSDSIARLTVALGAQRRATVEQQRVTAQLRLETIPALQTVIERDSAILALADKTIADQRLSIVQRDMRIHRLTKDLRGLRGERKGKLLGFLPRWTDEALLVAGTAVVAYRVGKARS
jgi:hypothetical protein